MQAYAEVLERENNDFTFTNNSLAASGSDFKDFTDFNTVDDQSQRTNSFSPFRNVTIYNKGTTLLLVYINQRASPRPLPSSTILELNGQRISSIRITNSDGATAGAYIMNANNDVKEINVLKFIAQVVRQ